MSLLLIDDDPLFCELLTSYLATAGLAVNCVSDGSAALRTLASGSFDLALLDVMLPGADGFVVLARIRERSNIPVLMLSARGDESDRVRGLDSGADDYLPKPFSSRELLARIRVLTRRTARAAQHMLEIGNIRLYPDQRSALVDGTRVVLTAVETIALTMLCQRAGRPVARDDLYRVALRRDPLPFDRSLDTHMYNLRKKLGVRVDGSPRILAVRGLGYQLSP